LAFIVKMDPVESSSSGASGGAKGRGMRVRARRAHEAQAAEQIDIRHVTPPIGQAVRVGEGLPGQMEQLALIQQQRDVASLMSEGGSRPMTAVHQVATRGMRADKYEIVQTRKPGAEKVGKHGDTVALLSNYFPLKKECNWCLYTHSVTFSTDIDSIGMRRRILRGSKEEIGSFIYDGTTLYSSKQLSMQVKGNDKLTNQEIIATIKFVGRLIPGEPMYMQFYNIMLRKCLFGMKLEQLGRNFYHPDKGIRFQQHQLELWPGYITAIGPHEKDTLLCVEVTHKVIRTETLLSVIKKMQATPGDYRKNVSEAVMGGIVLTSYNNKTYRIDDVDWTKNPMSTFEKNHCEVTFVDYFDKRYGVKITDFGQPLLVATIRQKDVHGGRVEHKVLLVPETCQMTGLTDDMRANFGLMKTLSEHLHMVPQKRIDAIKSFMKSLQSTPEISKELTGWGLEFGNELTKCPGRVLPREGIIFGPGGTNRPEMPNEKADWTMAFRKRQMLKCINMERWSIVVPQRDAAGVDNLVKLMIQVAKPLGLMIRAPLEIIKVPDGRSASYLSAVDSAVKNNLQLLFVILPNNKLDLYSTVKKRLSINNGIPSQCFLAKNLTNKGLMSIATKVVVQINAKLGGEPWSVQLPFKNAMVVGFDAYRGGGATKVNEKCGIGAIVSSLNASCSRYFSAVSNHKGHEELGSNLASDILKCLNAYFDENKQYPEKVIVFRDGVGEGQLRYVYDIETVQVQKSMNDFYLQKGLAEPKFTFIVVTKRINTRIFNERSNENPGPGTIVDDVITLPERYDFFMITAAARQGTVSPCSYNVLRDSGDMDADKIQRLTFKMCHLYYNWSGTVAVPAPCQYAHKLAFLAGMALGGAPSDALNTKLHFL